MAQTGNVTFGDTVYLYQESTASSIAAGIDSDDNIFKLSSSTSTDGSTIPSTNPNFLIDPSTNGNITFTPNGTGNLVLTKGTLSLPVSTGLTNGNISVNGVSVMSTGGIAFNSTIFLGPHAGSTTQTGVGNTGIGGRALANSTSGDFNTALGDASLQGITTGEHNIGVGVGAGQTYITEIENIVIGNDGTMGDNGVIRIGTNGLQQSCFIAGIDGINVGSVAKVVTETSDQLGTAVITAGTGISITPSANTITIAATTGAFTWSIVTGASQTIAVEHGYLSNRAGLITYTLPATANVGDMFRVSLINSAGSWTIIENAGQSIKFGSSDTTVTTGSLSSTANGDAIEIVCTIANTNFMVLSSIGNITLV